jgi:hypothetical protein
MMIKQFYEKALPSQGVYCVTGISKDGKVQNRFAQTLDELEEIVEALRDEGKNVFVAMSTFSGYSRRAESAIYARSFYIDLDVDPENAKKYPSKDEALAALDDFLKITKLPPPIRTDSGGGVHAYWLFDEDIPIPEWKKYVTKFKALCNDHIIIDNNVTGDAARILRCPETINYKNDLERPTKFLDHDFGQYSFQQFKEYLGEEASVADILATITPDLPPQPDNFEYVFKDVVIKSLQGQGCNQIKHIVLNQASIEEPLWRAGLSVAIRCVDGETAIHAMSDKHPEYNPADTEAKANETLNAKWAYGCNKFAELNPSGCDGCVFRNKFNKSGPIQLGRKLKELPTTETYSEEDAVRVLENPEEVPLFPAFLAPYVRGPNGGVWYKPKLEFDEEGNPIEKQSFPIIEYDFFALKRMHSPTDGQCMLMRYISPTDPVAEFLFPVNCAYSHDKIKDILPKNNVTFQPGVVKYISEYLIKWADYLKKQKAAEIMRMQMGWGEGFEYFVTGTQEITKDGIKPSTISPMIKNIARYFTPTGSYELWQKSANAFNLPGLEVHALGLLAGFGSPLMSRTSTPGATICYLSPDSGVGKTGSMYAGLSVFGQPYYISQSEGSATDNALTGRYLALRNIMYGLDEASNIENEVLSRLLHRISSGRAKSRMQSSVNAEREIEQGASLIAVMTTNQSLYDKLKQVKKRPDGEIARTLEFPLEMPEVFAKNPGLSKEIVDPFNFNYGHAGPIFVQYCLQKGEIEVKSRIAKWTARFREDYGANPAYRFYENMISSSFAGGELAVEANIVVLDIERIYKVVIQRMIDIRKNTFKLNETDYKELLGLFFNNHHSGFLILNEGKVVREPKAPKVVGRIEVHTGLQYISAEALEKYMNAPGMQVSMAAAEKAWLKDGILVKHPDDKVTCRKRLTTGWGVGTHQNAIKCYAFKTDLPEDFFDDSRPEETD